MTDREALRARHVKAPYNDRCGNPMCHSLWPCDAIRALDGWDAAEQDAAALAEIVDEGLVNGDIVPGPDVTERARRALAAHRERVKEDER